VDSRPGITAKTESPASLVDPPEDTASLNELLASPPSSGAGKYNHASSKSETKIEQQVCDRGKYASWIRRVQRMIPPPISVIDRNSALGSAIAGVRHQARIESCFLHLRQAMIKYPGMGSFAFQGQRLHS